MSNKSKVLTGKQLIKLLESIGFKEIRVNGSHHRMKHNDGRITTVPVHGNSDLPKGLLRKIVREDLKMQSEEFDSIVLQILKNK